MTWLYFSKFIVQVRALQLLNEALKLKIIFCLVDAGRVNDIAKQEKHDAKN